MPENLRAQLPRDIASASVQTAQGLDMHYLQAGEPGAPVLLLLHGFPELAFSWRKVMPTLAAAGYHVIAPDQRGYGRTTGWVDGYDVPLEPYRMTSLVLDQVALLTALGIDRVHGVVGHDFGSPVAAWCALVRPDLFPRLAMMSAPFAGPPGFRGGGKVDLDAALAQLAPPRKHYQWYYSEHDANEAMMACSQGLLVFLAQYYYLKSALWHGNNPRPLSGWQASELAQMPGYYVMPRGRSMAETVAQDCAGEDLGRLANWLPDAELSVYSAEFGRTGFQGGLNWYRASVDPGQARYLRLYGGRAITVPACFIAGEQDWGRHQSPGALTAMATRACADFRGTHVVADAGHWVQQEQPDAVADLLLGFMRE